MQGVRRGKHLPARSDKERVQGMQRGEHLPAQSDKEQVQDVQSRQGRVDAAGSRGALTSIHISFAQAEVPLQLVLVQSHADCTMLGIPPTSCTQVMLWCAATLSQQFYSRPGSRGALILANISFCTGTLCCSGQFVSHDCIRYTFL